MTKASEMRAAHEAERAAAYRLVPQDQPLPMNMPLHYVERIVRSELALVGRRWWAADVRTALDDGDIERAWATMSRFRLVDFMVAAREGRGTR